MGRPKYSKLVGKDDILVMRSMRYNSGSFLHVEGSQDPLYRVTMKLVGLLSGRPQPGESSSAPLVKFLSRILILGLQVLFQTDILG